MAPIVYLRYSIVAINAKFNILSRHSSFFPPGVNWPERHKARENKVPRKTLAAEITVRGRRSRTKRVYLLIENYEPPRWWLRAAITLYYAARTDRFPGGGEWARESNGTAVANQPELDRFQDDEAEHGMDSYLVDNRHKLSASLLLFRIIHGARMFCFPFDARDARSKSMARLSRFYIMGNEGPFTICFIVVSPVVND